ncbi:MAG: hypothetical protein MSK40_01410, partial [Parabacteroides sp.]|nr:hypothetical protein [Parabacteroides sp.]
KPCLFLCCFQFAQFIVPYANANEHPFGYILLTSIFVIEIEKAPSLFCYAQCNNGACRVLSFCRNYRKLTVYCLDKISETPFERDIISSNCECCVTSFINLVKEAAYPIFLILSRKSKRTVDVAKIFFVCRMSMAI